ncbi:MAG: Unknown protein, partial [uncultured Sulfurovum sp.]
EFSKTPKELKVEEEFIQLLPLYIRVRP